MIYVCGAHNLPNSKVVVTAKWPRPVQKQHKVTGLYWANFARVLQLLEKKLYSTMYSDSCYLMMCIHIICFAQHKCLRAASVIVGAASAAILPFLIQWILSSSDPSIFITMPQEWKDFLISSSGKLYCLSFFHLFHASCFVWSMNITTGGRRHFSQYYLICAVG